MQLPACAARASTTAYPTDKSAYRDEQANSYDPR